MRLAINWINDSQVRRRIYAVFGEIRSKIRSCWAKIWIWEANLTLCYPGVLMSTNSLQRPETKISKHRHRILCLPRENQKPHVNILYMINDPCGNNSLRPQKSIRHLQSHFRGHDTHVNILIHSALKVFDGVASTISSDLDNGAIMAKNRRQNNI